MAAEHVNFRDFFEDLPVAIHILGDDGTILLANRAELDLLGYPAKEYIGRHIAEFHADQDNICDILARLANGEKIKSRPARLLANDGCIRDVRITSSGHLQDGEFAGTRCVTLDAEGEEAEARLAAIVVSSNDAIVSKTLDGVITSWNPGAARLFGFEPNEIVGQPIMRIIPPELHDEEREILAKLRKGERIEHYDTVRVAKNGRRIDVSLSISPVRNRSGRLIGAAKVARDITERKRSEALQRHLLAELDHRVKNNLAIAQAIASQTLRSTVTPAEFADNFIGRIRSLARTHDLLASSNWEGVELGALIEAQTGAEKDERIACSGPRIVLPPQLVSNLALVFHELGTNARKHGALSAANGSVAVDWTVEPKLEPILKLRWSERDSALVHKGTRSTGFGTLLIERSMKSVTGGHAVMLTDKHGVTWEIALELPRCSILPALPGLKSSRDTVDRQEPRR